MVAVTRYRAKQIDGEVERIDALYKIFDSLPRRRRAPTSGVSKSRIRKRRTPPRSVPPNAPVYQRQRRQPVTGVKKVYPPRPQNMVQTRSITKAKEAALARTNMQTQLPTTIPQVESTMPQRRGRGRPRKQVQAATVFDTPDHGPQGGCMTPPSVENENDATRTATPHAIPVEHQGNDDVERHVSLYNDMMASLANAEQVDQPTPVSGRDGHLSVQKALPKPPGGSTNLPPVNIENEAEMEFSSLLGMISEQNNNPPSPIGTEHASTNNGTAVVKAEVDDDHSEYTVLSSFTGSSVIPQRMQSLNGTVQYASGATTSEASGSTGFSRYADVRYLISPATTSEASGSTGFSRYANVRYLVPAEQQREFLTITEPEQKPQMKLKHPPGAFHVYRVSREE